MSSPCLLIALTTLASTKGSGGASLSTGREIGSVGRSCGPYSSYCLLHAASTPENFPFSTNLGMSFLISATANRLLGWQTSGVLRSGVREIDISEEFWLDRPVLACHDDIITSLLNLNTWDFSKPCSTGEKENLCEVPERRVDPGYSGWDGSLPPTPFEGLPRLGCSFGRPACLCSYTSDQLLREYCPLLEKSSSSERKL